MRLAGLITRRGTLGKPPTRTRPPPPPKRGCSGPGSTADFVQMARSSDGWMGRLAELLVQRDILHREAAGRKVRLFFADAGSAARTGLQLAEQLSAAVGLHTGPLK